MTTPNNEPSPLVQWVAQTIAKTFSDFGRTLTIANGVCLGLIFYRLLTL